MTEGARVLAVCSGGGLGDLLAATPAMCALQRRFGTKLSVLASAYAAPILDGHPAVSEIIIADSLPPGRAGAAAIAARRFTHAVVFWSSARVAALIQRARVPVRVGQSRRLYSWRYTKRVAVRTEAGDVTSHWTDVQMDYARALGAKPISEDFRIIVDVRERDAAEAQAVMQRYDIGPRFVVLHAARGMSLQNRRLPRASFAAIADFLGEALGATVVLTGSAGEAEHVGGIGALMRRPSAVIAGATSIRGLAALLAKAAVVVALDSGPMHVAAAVGTPTVGIFALRSDLPDRWRPLGPRVALVLPSYPCPAGHRKENCPDFACYAALSPSAVVAKARQLANAPVAL